MADPGSPAPPSPDARSNHGSAAVVLYLIAAFATGVAIQVKDGNYSPAALAWLTAGLLATGWAAAGGTIPLPQQHGQVAFAGLAAAVIVAQAWLLAEAKPAPLQVEPVAGVPLPILAVTAGALALALVPACVWPVRYAEPHRTPGPAGLPASAGSDAQSSSPVRTSPLVRAVHHVAFAALVVVWLGMGAWVLAATPEPVQDVWVFQHDASIALLRGENPYAMTFPDLSFGTSPFYGPGMQADGRLLFGFVYPPLSLLFSVAGLLAGEVRYAQAAAILAAAVLMAYARPGPVGRVLAAVFLLTPRGLFVLSQGWTEPFVVLLLAATVFVACRQPAALAAPLGPFWAVKQYAVLSGPLVLLLMPQPIDRRALARTIGGALLVAAVATVPFLLWDAKAFWWSVVEVQFRQPFRPDALSYLAGWNAWRGTPLPSAVAFAGLIGAMAVCLWRSPRSPAGYAGAVAFTFFVFFALNKQAFANYYYFVIGAAACAGAAISSPVPAAAEPAPTGEASREPAPRQKLPPEKRRKRGRH